MSNVVIKSVIDQGIILEISEYPIVRLILESFEQGIMQVSTNFCNIDILLEAVVSFFDENSNLYGIIQIEFDFNERHIIVNKENANVQELIKEYYKSCKGDILLKSKIQFRNSDAKRFWLELIDCGYSIEIIKFAQKWAERMQEEIESGGELKDIAQKSACIVSKGKEIPPYMQYGAMVILSGVWKFGEELRRWYCDKSSNYYGEPITFSNCKGIE